MNDSPILVSVPESRWTGLWDDKAPVEMAVWDLTEPPDDTVRDRVEFVVLPYLDRMDLSLLSALPRLQVVQLLTAGYDGVIEHLPDGVTLANAAGVHDDSTAELAVGLTIAQLRGLGQAAVDQRQGRWRHEHRTSLADRRVLLIGVGSVGHAIAARLRPFQVTLTRVGTSAREDDHGRVHGVDQLDRLLPDHDVVILAVPLTSSTKGMVDRRFLAAMPDGALLVNVARGEVVRTDALVSELTAGRLSAALDVTDPEPLPSDHPLWTAPNTLITPHVGGDTTAFAPRARALLRDQLERFVAGRSLRNQIVTGESGSD